VAEHLPSAAGFLVEKEIDYLSRATTNPDHPYVAVMGGAKVSDKIQVLRNLLDKVDAMLIGGAMAYTFLKQQAVGVGASLVEEDRLDVAAELLERRSAPSTTRSPTAGSAWTSAPRPSPDTNRKSKRPPW